MREVIGGSRNLNTLSHLALRDVAGEVGDGVRDVVVRHRQDGQLCDGALATLNAACGKGERGAGACLVAGRQVERQVHARWLGGGWSAGCPPGDQPNQCV